MRYLVTAAAAAMLSAGAAQAAVVDLTYTVEAELVAYDYFDGGFPYEFQGAIGDVVSFNFSVPIDTSESYAGPVFFDDFIFYVSYYQDFDPATGSVYLYDMTSGDTLEEFWLNPNGSGTVREVATYENALVYANLDYDVLSWEVDGLSEIAPIPLPASAPLLAFGMAGFWALRRKHRPDPASNMRHTAGRSS